MEAHPEDGPARFLSIPVPTHRLVQAFGPEFKPGTRVSCDKCLGGCWGFDKLPERAARGGQVGTVVGTAMSDDGEVDMTIAVADDWQPAA